MTFKTRNDKVILLHTSVIGYTTLLFYCRVRNYIFSKLACLKTILPKLAKRLLGLPKTTAQSIVDDDSPLKAGIDGAQTTVPPEEKKNNRAIQGYLRTLNTNTIWSRGAQSTCVVSCHRTAGNGNGAAVAVLVQK